MIVLPNGSYSLELNQTVESSGTVVVTLKFHRVGEAQQPVSGSNFQSVEEVKEMFKEVATNLPPQTMEFIGNPWGQTKTEVVTQQTPNLDQVRSETKEIMDANVQQTQPLNPWGSAQPSVNPVSPVVNPVPTQPQTPGWGQSNTQQIQPVQPQPTGSPWGGAVNQTVESKPVEVSQNQPQSATAVMDPPKTEEPEKKKPKGRPKKLEQPVQPVASPITVNGLRSNTQPDGTVIFTKNEANDISNPYLIKYPTTDGFFSIEVYKDAFNVLGDLLNKYNAQFNQEKNCGVLTINDEIFTTEFLQLLIR